MTSSLRLPILRLLAVGQNVVSPKGEIFSIPENVHFPSRNPQGPDTQFAPKWTPPHNYAPHEGNRLSARSSFPRMWRDTERWGGSVWWGHFLNILTYRKSWLCLKTYDAGFLQALHSQGRTLNFREGLEFLPTELSSGTFGCLFWIRCVSNGDAHGVISLFFRNCSNHGKHATRRPHRWVNSYVRTKLRDRFILL